MTSNVKRIALAAVVLVATACDVFREPTPEIVAFRMTGSEGASVMAIYARDFVAGSTELGGTRVQVFGTDTVFHTLPIDTVFDISRSSQFFVQVEGVTSDTLEVSVAVDVDDRNVMSQSGGIFPGQPWRYVYQFNRFFGTIVEVII